MTDELDIDALLNPQPVPQRQVIDYHRPAPRGLGSGGFLGYVIAAVLLFMLLSSNKGCDGSLPNQEEEQISVRVDGPAVMLTWDDSGTATEGQSDVLTTTKVQTWCEQNGFRYRKFDVDDDLSRAEPYWQVMMSSAAAPPSLTIAKANGQAVTLALPSTVQETIQRIEKEGN